MSPRGGYRRGSGCKKRLEGGHVMSIYLDTATLDKIEYWCRQRNLSRSEGVRRMVCLAYWNGERKGEK